MKDYTAEELKEILELHEKWFNDINGGVRADLSYADLRSADLSYANLRSANLRYADLSSADLSYANLRSANLRSADLSYANLRSANLRSANLRSADLSYADLSYANLRSANLRSADLSSANLRYADLRSANLRSANLSSANLSYANLSSANLRYAIGEMRSLRSFQIEKYTVSYTDSILNIGCQSHTIEEWGNFDDKQISNMDEDAIEWWTKWKQIIFQIIEMSPAEPTGFKPSEEE